MIENLQMLENKFNLPQKNFSQGKLWKVSRMTIQEEIESWSLQQLRKLNDKKGDSAYYIIII